MRGLTAEEVAVLNGSQLSDDASDPAHEIAKRLVARGLFTAHEMTFRGVIGTGYYRTPLGNLALRVAVAVPRVLP